MNDFGEGQTILHSYNTGPAGGENMGLSGSLMLSVSVTLFSRHKADLKGHLTETAIGE